MVPSFESGAFLGHVFGLESGARVRLRLARTSDAEAVRALLAARGLELEAARLVHFNPRRRYVVCATALIDGSERLIGVGAITLDQRKTPTPQLLVVDDEHADEVVPLLTRALVGTAELIARARAA